MVPWAWAAPVKGNMATILPSRTINTRTGGRRAGRERRQDRSDSCGGTVRPPFSGAPKGVGALPSSIASKCRYINRALLICARAEVGTTRRRRAATPARARPTREKSPPYGLRPVRNSRYFRQKFGSREPGRVERCPVFRTPDPALRRWALHGPLAVCLILVTGALTAGCTADRPQPPPPPRGTAPAQG